MRLIDADVFVKKVIEYSHQSTKTIGMALDATPTVDAVCVVRCKDCAFFFEFKNHDTDLGDGYCDWLDKYVGIDKYCAYGMERSNE